VASPLRTKRSNRRLQGLAAGPHLEMSPFGKLPLMTMA
jgi:hypothetical protein